jgi:DNA-binding IclR family transcriptional regulator
VGVLDKAMAVLAAVETSPLSLAELVERTGFSRATAHRLAVALEAHGLIRRDDDGRFCLGLRLISLGHEAAEAVPVWAAARPALAWLHDQTGESVQLFVRDGDVRVCVDSIESSRELRTIVPVGARLPLDAGSAGRVLSAGGDPRTQPSSGPPASAARAHGAGAAAGAASSSARGHGAGSTAGARSSTSGKPWVQSVGEREEGVASVSAGVHGPDGRVLAAVSVSGPIQRLSTKPGAKYGDVVAEAARRIESAAGLA